jgi:transcriptional regulator with XRE-family HTH domain
MNEKDSQKRIRSFLRAFGGRLNDVRQRRGHTQATLAKELGCSEDMVGRYERGLSFPSGLALARLAYALDITVDYLVTGRSVSGVVDSRLLERLQALEALPAKQLIKALGVLDAVLKGGAEPDSLPRPA